MFSSLSTNNFEGRVKLKNKLFSKKKALISNDGLDLKKIKVKFNEKWIYIQFLCNIFKVFMLSENQQAYASDFAFFIVFIELQKQLSKFLLISMNFAIQGKHCVETWATICDQNNPIIIRDLDREECRVGPRIFGTFWNRKVDNRPPKERNQYRTSTPLEKDPLSSSPSRAKKLHMDL